MAYVSQDKKKQLAVGIRAVLKKYDMKATIAVQHHSTLIVNISQGAIDFSDYMNRGEFPRDYIQVNEYWLDENYDGIALAFLKELLEAMKGPDFFNHDDSMTDYFHRSHYTEINIGRYGKPYAFVKGSKINVHNDELKADPTKEAYIVGV